MKVIAILVVVIVLLFLLGVLSLWHRQHTPHEETRADLVPRWKAFLETPAPAGEPTIAPAAVPPIAPLKAEGPRRTLRVSRFHQRGGR